MKKKFLCLALAAMMIGGNLSAALPAYAAGGNTTTVTLTKDADAPYEGREYIVANDKKTVQDITLPDGWTWENPAQELTTEFVNAVVQQKDGDAVVNSVTVKVKKYAADPDTEAPTGTIRIENDSWNSFLNTVTFNKLFKQTKSVTIEASDNVGVASVKYFASAGALTLDEVKNLKESDWITYPEAGFTLEPTSDYVVYAVITDTSENKTYISSDGMVFLTEKAPDILVTEVTQNSFKVKANVDEKALDGIKSVGIKYRKVGESGWTTISADTVNASNELSVTGLDAGEKYEVRTFVIYTDGSTMETSEEHATRITTEAKEEVKGELKSVVEVADDVPAVAVEGVADIIQDTAIVSEKETEQIESGEISVSVKLQVESASSEESDVKKIENLANQKGLTLGTVLDISLYKITSYLMGDGAGTNTTTNIGGVNTQILEIAVPYDTSKDDLSVYRCHSGEITELTRLEAKPDRNQLSDGTYFIGDGYIYIYASKYSLYAICEKDLRADEPKADNGDTYNKVTKDDGGNEVVNTASKTESVTPATVATSPKTGDEGQMFLWISILSCSILTMGIVVLTNRKKKKA